MEAKKARTGYRKTVEKPKVEEKPKWQYGTRFTAGQTTYIVQEPLEKEESGGQDITLFCLESNSHQRYSSRTLQQYLDNGQFRFIDHLGTPTKQPVPPPVLYTVSSSTVSAVSVGPNVQAIGVKAPTGNCQWYSVSNFNALHSRKDERLKIMKKMHTAIGKPMVLIDINKCNEQMVTEMFPEGDIVIRQPYTSTNGSSMILFLIRTKILNS